MAPLPPTVAAQGTPSFERQHPGQLIPTAQPPVYLTIAETHVEIAAHRGIAPTDPILKRMQPFYTPHNREIALQITPRYEPSQVPYHESSRVEVRTTSEGTVRYSGAQFVLELSTNSSVTRGDLTYQANFEQILGGLRLALAHHLIHTSRGVLLHASAAMVDELVHCFPGPSGTGKSTAIASTPGTILADEIVALVLKGEGLRAWGTPFGNRLLPSAVPGGRVAIHRIIKAPENSLHPLSMGEQLSLLLGAVVFLCDTNRQGHNVLQIISAVLTRATTVDALHCTADGRFWNELFLKEFQ